MRESVISSRERGFVTADSGADKAFGDLDDSDLYYLYSIELLENIEMLSQKAKYAMRALLYLAQAQPERPVFISEIADQQSVPKKFLELILLDLKRHGLVHSYRGKKGGYALAKTPDQIHFGQVIRIIDGPLAQLPCASRTAYRRCDDCENEQTCEIRRVMLQVRDSTAKILDNTSLADVMVRGRAELVEGAGI